MSDLVCPECLSENVQRTGMGSGNITPTYARITSHVRCQDCGKWFRDTTEYDKTKATEASKQALRQVRQTDAD